MESVGWDQTLVRSISTAVNDVESPFFPVFDLAAEKKLDIGVVAGISSDHQISLSVCFCLNDPSVTLDEVSLLFQQSVKSLTLNEFDRDHLRTPVLVSKPIIFGGRSDGFYGLQWETNCGVVDSFVLVGSDSSTLKRVEDAPVNTIQIAPSTFVHRTELKLPIGNAAYAVQTGDYRSYAQDISLRSASSQDFLLALTSDNQWNAPQFRHQLSHIARLQPDMLVHVGDFVQDPVRKEYRTYWTGPLETSSISQRIPLCFARGNHDGEHPLSYAYAFGAGNSAWSAFTVADTRIILLDSNIVSTGVDKFLFRDQTRWLKEQLEGIEWKSARFRVVFVHVPPFIEYWDVDVYRENEVWSFVRTVWFPLLQKARVSLVVSGHSHIYQRGQSHGVHVAIIGGAGGDLDYAKAWNWGDIYAVTRTSFHYALLQNKGNRLQFSSHEIEGELIDQILIDPVDPLS